MYTKKMNTISEVAKKIRKKLLGGVVNLTPNGVSRGRVLLSYTTLPFISQQAESGHTNRFECQRMAEIYAETGYAVDIVDFDNESFVPKKHYNYCIDIQNKLEKFSAHLNKDCVKIFHITTAHWLWNNTAEYRRLLDIKERRGVALMPRRTLPPSRNIELADVVTILGNDFTAGTYGFSKKTMHRIPISTTHLYPSPENKNFESARNGFVWIGGVGMAHKGLDLVLEAFAEMPEFRLTVFGKKDIDFAQTYHKELYKTPNIRYIGHTDPGGDDFASAVRNSIALIFPSCSEGSSGGVVTAMHAGLIPLISYESGITVDSFGAVLEKNTIAEIQKEIKSLVSLPPDTLKLRATQAWSYARAHHTRETFSMEYKKFVNKLIANNKTQK